MRKIRFKFSGKTSACCLNIQTACDYIANNFSSNFKARSLMDDKLEEINNWGQDAMPGDQIEVAEGLFLEPYIPKGYVAPKIKPR